MVQTCKFGEMDGRDVVEAIIEDGETRLSILSYGAVTRDWRVGDVPVVLGLNTLEDYLVHSNSFGVIAGRVANRIAKGRFELNGEMYRVPVNNGENHLHGGPAGLGFINWTLETDKNAVRLSHHSPDGDQGYPGAVAFTVDISIENGRVIYDMTGVPDRETPINLAQHNYYNLNGGGDVRGHRVWVDADRYTEVDEGLIPTGRILPIDGTPMDFREATTIGQRDPEGIGIDVNTVLREGRDMTAPCAIVTADKTDLLLKLWSEEPGLQLFDAPLMDIEVPGLDGQRYGAFAGLCLEAQHFPDSVNHDHFPSILRSPENPYHQKLIVEIS